MHLEPPSQVEAASISASAARQARAEALVRRTEPADVAALLGDLDLLFSAIEPHLLADAAPLAGVVSAAADVLASAHALGWHTLATAAAAAPPPKEAARPAPAPEAPPAADAGPAKKKKKGGGRKAKAKAAKAKAEAESRSARSPAPAPAPPPAGTAARPGPPQRPPTSAELNKLDLLVEAYPREADINKLLGLLREADGDVDRAANTYLENHAAADDFVPARPRKGRPAATFAQAASRAAPLRQPASSRAPAEPPTESSAPGPRSFIVKGSRLPADDPLRALGNAKLAQQLIYAAARVGLARGRIHDFAVRALPLKSGDFRIAARSGEVADVLRQDTAWLRSVSGRLDLVRGPEAHHIVVHGLPTAVDYYEPTMLRALEADVFRDRPSYKVDFAVPLVRHTGKARRSIVVQVNCAAAASYAIARGTCSVLGSSDLHPIERYKRPLPRSRRDGVDPGMTQFAADRAKREWIGATSTDRRRASGAAPAKPAPTRREAAPSPPAGPFFSSPTAFDLLAGVEDDPWGRDDPPPAPKPKGPSIFGAKGPVALSFAYSLPGAQVEPTFLYSDSGRIDWVRMDKAGIATVPVADEDEPAFAYNLGRAHPPRHPSPFVPPRRRIDLDGVVARQGVSRPVSEAAGAAELADNAILAGLEDIEWDWLPDCDEQLGYDPPPDWPLPADDDDVATPFVPVQVTRPRPRPRPSVSNGREGLLERHLYLAGLSQSEVAAVLAEVAAKELARQRGPAYVDRSVPTKAHDGGEPPSERGRARTRADTPDPRRRLASAEPRPAQRPASPAGSDLAHELEARLALDDGAHGRSHELDELFMTPRGDAPDSDDEPAEPASPSRPPRSDRGVGAQ